jgi:hypothetical protein
VLRGFVFLGLGLVISSFIPLGNTIGGIGFIYYVFHALSWLKPFTVQSKETDLEIWLRIKEIEMEFYGKPDEDTIKKLAELENF